MSEVEATWEDYAEFQQQFPNYHLEDKVEFKGGSVVRGPIEEGQLDNLEESQIITKGKRKNN